MSRKYIKVAMFIVIILVLAVAVPALAMGPGGGGGGGAAGRRRRRWGRDDATNNLSVPTIMVGGGFTGFTPTETPRSVPPTGCPAQRLLD